MDMSSTRRLHVWQKDGGALECDRAEVMSVTSWLRRAAVGHAPRESSAALAPGRHAGRAWRGVEHPYAPRPTRDRRPRPTIDAFKALYESPDP